MLHCPDVVGGHAPQLARSERSVGLDSWSVSYSRGPFEYACDEVLWKDTDSVMTKEVTRLKLLWRAATKFDVVHFNFGTSICPSLFGAYASERGVARRILRTAYSRYAKLLAFRDLPLLRNLGKAIFVTYQGDDARQADYCRAHFDTSPVDEVEATYYAAGSDETKREGIARFDRYADQIYSLNPDLLHVLPERAQFLPYAHVDPREWTPTGTSTTSARPLVVHAPSHRGVKGTRFIVDAVNRLRADGVAFDFQLVEGLPRAEARRIYERADLVVDQLIVGWYGGLAVEAMALGKPVIAFLRAADLLFVAPEMRKELPVIQATPQTIFEVLKQWLTVRRRDLPDVGARSRRFMECWHDPVLIARRTKTDYERALLKRRGPGISGKSGWPAS